MEITLVKPINGSEVHGTDNDKRTGCGINLLKAENVTRYRRCGAMNDLKELTCEKCKNTLAKRIIKADKKEMSRLIKEERLRAKKGIEDLDIVPLGNTVAKITRTPEQIRAEADRKYAEERAAEKRANQMKAEEEKRLAEIKADIAAKSEVEKQASENIAPKTIPGTGVAFDNSLAAFAINVPKDNNTQNNNAAKTASVPENSQVKSAPSQQDDFLAQFAIKAPAQEQFQSSETKNNQTAAVNIDNNVQQSTDDFMKQFSIGNNSSMDMEVLSNKDPVETSIYDNDDAVVDIREDELAKDDTYYGNDASLQEEEKNLEKNPQWDYVANQLFGFAGVDMPDLDSLENTDVVAQKSASETPVSAPVLEDISAPVLEDLTAPEVPVSAPVFEDLTAPEVPVSAPVLEDLTVPEAPVSAPVLEDLTAPVFENLTTPEVPVTPSVPENLIVPEVPVSEPVIEKITTPETPVSTPEPEVASVQPEINNAGQFAVISAPQLVGYDANGQPVYNYIKMKLTGHDANGQPIYAPLQPMVAPVQPSIPVQPVAAPVQPGTPVQPVIAPVQPGIPVQPMAPYRVPTANISKIATHQHSRPMPQSFVNALANSRELGKKNLIETQAMNKMPVLESVEAVLTEMGDDVAVKKTVVESKNVPVFEEYKSPVRNYAKAQVKPINQQRMLTKSEMKAQRKQDKIDAKFKKDLAKRGF